MDAGTPRDSEAIELHQAAERSIRRGTPDRSGLSSVRRPETTAQRVVASLVLPEARPASLQPVSPLSLADLHQLPRDASMLYDIGRLDSSGRVASNDIIHALRWQQGTRLDVILTPRTIVIRASSNGLFSVPRRPCIAIPSDVRRPHGINPGDLVLIAAAPDHDLVIVYPISALDEMISRYHSASREAGYPQ
jgi:hypothetical protein